MNNLTKPEKPYWFDTITKLVIAQYYTMWKSTLWEYLKSMKSYRKLLKKYLTWMHNRVCWFWVFMEKKSSARHFLLEVAILWCHNKFEVNPILFAPPTGHLKIEHILIKVKFWSFEIWGLLYIQSCILKF